MKKLITIAAATAILAAATATTILANRNTDPIFQANIEALMHQEGDPAHGELCYNSITAKKSSLVVYCGTCTYVNGVAIIFSSSDICP